MSLVSCPLSPALCRLPPALRRSHDVPRAIRQLARLHQPANRQLERLVLLAGQLQLLGDHPRLDGLILRAQDVGQHDRLEPACRGGRPLGRRRFFTFRELFVCVLWIGIYKQLVHLVVLRINTHNHNLSVLQNSLKRPGRIAGVQGLGIRGQNKRRRQAWAKRGRHAPPGYNSAPVRFVYLPGNARKPGANRAQDADHPLDSFFITIARYSRAARGRGH